MDPLLRLGLLNAALAAVLAIGVAVIVRVGRRPALAHGLWLLVLLKLVTPPLVDVPIPLPAQGTPTSPVEGEKPVAVPTLGPPSGTIFRPGGTEEVAPVQAPVAASLPSSDPVPANLPQPEGLEWKTIAVAVWLAGSLLWWVIASIRTARFGWLLRQARLAPDDLQARVRVFAHRLGMTRFPAVRLVDAPLAPLLWALGQSPCLLLPTGLWSRLSEEQRDTLLVHELAHLRRGDHWVRRLELVVLGLYWWHPVVWWARRELQEAEEQCCDAWVTWALPEAAPAYAAALVETVAFLSCPRSALPLGASGGGPARHLKRRLTMILRGTSSRTLSWGGLLLILCLALGLLPLMPTWARPAADEPTGRVPKPTAPRPDPLLPPAEPQAVNPTVRPPQPRVEGSRGANRAGRPGVEEARDEVELLEAGLAVKRAQLEAAHVVLKGAEDRLALISRLGDSGSISQGEIAKAREEVGTRKADVLIKQAELKEAEVRLNQARRRLKALQEPLFPPAEDPKAVEAAEKKAADEARRVQQELDRVLQSLKKEDSVKRIEDLAKKLEQLRRELEDLRREIKPDRPAGNTNRGRDGVYYSNERRFRVPFAIDPARVGQIQEVVLYVSNDEGRAWHVAAREMPEQKSFTFVAPADGSYSFKVEVIDQEGRPEPRDVTNAPTLLRVVVDTVKPVIEMKSQRKGEDVALTWKITEDNLDYGRVELEYRTRDMPGGTWKPLLLNPAEKAGETKFRPAGAGPVTVRMRARDLAGNEAVLQTEVEGAKQS
jgi:beta-lactamase regulating signal transducer with metallopeptidase domain